MRAKTSPTPARGPASTAPVQDSGSSSLESFARWDPASLSWRTSQRCLLAGLTPFSERWPRSGTMRSGAAFVRPTWALGTAGTESSSSATWPTPDASVANDSETLESWEARRARVKATGINGNGMGAPLAIAVRLWPTTTTSDARASGAAGYSTESGRHAGTTLTDAVNGMWATPVARDEKGPTGAGRTSRRKSPQVPDQAGCKGRQSLNPAWVEQLMGFPPGWTLPGPDSLSTPGKPHASRRRRRTEARDSAPLATPSCRKSLKSSAGG